MRRRRPDNLRLASAALVSMSLVAAAALLAVAAPADTVVAPTVTEQPDIAVVGKAGDSASFTAAAGGSPAPTVQWQEAPGRDGPWTSIAGATDTTLAVTGTDSNLGHAFRALFTNAGGTAITRPAKLVSKENWMRDLGGDIDTVPLTELTIPGTHDTGTYAADGDGATSKDHQGPWCETSFSSDSICQSYAKAQSQDITHELNAGIRYFDLRICGRGDLPDSPYPPDFLAISDHPVTCHELVSATLDQILTQTADWAAQHPAEVVYLDFNHHFQVNLDKEATEIEQAFDLGGGRSMLIPPEYCTPGDATSGTCAGNLTLSTIHARNVAQGYVSNVIVNFEQDPGAVNQERCFPNDENPSFDYCSRQFIGQQGILPSFYYTHYNFWGLTSSVTGMEYCTIAGAEASCFGNDTDPPTILSRAKNFLDTRQSFAEAHPAYQFQHFFVQFLQTTPDTTYVLEHLTGSLKDMADESNPVVGPGIFGCGEWGVSTCFAQDRPENLNILALNFYERMDYCDTTCFFGTGIPLHFDFVREVVKFDEYSRTAPVVRVAASTAPAATGWYNAAVLGGQGKTLQVGVSAEDYLYPTGITALDCTDTAGTLTLAHLTTGANGSADFALGDGVHGITCSATDGANKGTHQVGNAGAGPGSTQPPAGFQVDTTPPVITCPTTTALLLNQPTSSLTGTVTDATSGVASTTTPAAFSTASVGSFTGMLTASDRAGNTATVNCSYTVSYRVVRRYDPTRLWNSGSTVPIKVELDDYNYKDVSDKSIQVLAKTVTDASGTTRVPTSPGGANPGFVFYITPAKGYEYDLKTSGYPKGSYTLDLVAGRDPVVYHEPFVIR